MSWSEPDLFNPAIDEYARTRFQLVGERSSLAGNLG